MVEGAKIRRSRSRTVKVSGRLRMATSHMWYPWAVLSAVLMVTASIAAPRVANAAAGAAAQGPRPPLRKRVLDSVGWAGRGAGHMVHRTAKPVREITDNLNHLLTRREYGKLARRAAYVGAGALALGSVGVMSFAAVKLLAWGAVAYTVAGTKLGQSTHQFLSSLAHKVVRGPTATAIEVAALSVGLTLMVLHPFPTVAAIAVGYAAAQTEHTHLWNGHLGNLWDSLKPRGP